MILGAFFLVISILELLPNFNQTKDLLPFLPLTLLHILIIGLVLGILGYFFLKMDFIIPTLSLIVFLFLYKVLFSFVVVHLIFLVLE